MFYITLALWDKSACQISAFFESLVRKRQTAALVKCYSGSCLYPYSDHRRLNWSVKSIYVAKPIYLLTLVLYEKKKKIKAYNLYYFFFLFTLLDHSQPQLWHYSCSLPVCLATVLSFPYLIDGTHSELVGSCWSQTGHLGRRQHRIHVRQVHPPRRIWNRARQLVSEINRHTAIFTCVAAERGVVRQCSCRVRSV